MQQKKNYNQTLDDILPMLWFTRIVHTMNCKSKMKWKMRQGGTHPTKTVFIACIESVAQVQSFGGGGVEWGAFQNKK